MVAWAALLWLIAASSTAEARGGGKSAGLGATSHSKPKTSKGPSNGIHFPKTERLPKPQKNSSSLKPQQPKQRNVPRQQRTTKRSPLGPRSNVRLAARNRALRADSSQYAAEWTSDLPQREVLRLALQAYACGEREGSFDQPYLTIIDYSLPSSVRRLWVVDVRSRRVLRNELVAHGRNSGEDFAVEFSNDPGSMQSSIGLFRTEDVYRGRHGDSLRLIGLEPGINDRAEERKIVMHGAWYVSAAYAAEHGQLGRSWGCPALPLGVHHRIIDTIKGGSAVFAYYPDEHWLRGSRFLHCDARLAAR
jgi:hypothetical protein